MLDGLKCEPVPLVRVAQLHPVFNVHAPDHDAVMPYDRACQIDPGAEPPLLAAWFEDLDEPFDDPVLGLRHCRFKFRTGMRAAKNIRASPATFGTFSQRARPSDDEYLTEIVARLASGHCAPNCSDVGFGLAGKTLDLGRDDQTIPTAEVVVEHRWGDADLIDDVVDAHGRLAAGIDGRHGKLEDPGPVVIHHGSTLEGRRWQ